MFQPKTRCVVNPDVGWKDLRGRFNYTGSTLVVLVGNDMHHQRPAGT